MAKSANESLYYAVARRCTAMFRHVPACPGMLWASAPSHGPLHPSPNACPATTTATTLYRLLFIYYLFDMLGVVAGKEVEEDGGGDGDGDTVLDGHFVSLCSGCSFFPLSSLSLSFWGSLFIYLFIIIVMLCISFLNLYSII